ncbi:hypothetical protein AYO41_02110 [Verrucomicrobia bacterium SCGC AG-212-E04]|nr:hypothetical protein AYO41_02110 [Verrucomicrobia bacterium SCGC AG-212-E04]
MEHSVVRLPMNTVTGPKVAVSRMDFDPEICQLFERVQPFTMTSPERMYALVQAIDYITDNHLPGAIVECGVWRGGSMMLAALRLLERGDSSRDIFLFDTFEGMPPPTTDDVRYDGEPAAQLLAQERRLEGSHLWAHSTLEEVHRNVLSTGYPMERVHFIRGRVEVTIPSSAPECIALLRLDTDWYESTAHELSHLFPRLGTRCPLIIDDYGYWKGARRAVDEYFSTQAIRPLLNRIDETGRCMLKMDADET